MIKHKTIDEIMQEGWTEVSEFGFGRKSIIYEKGTDRMIYDEVKQEIITSYSVAEPKYERSK
jgi:hypothetical protein